MAKTKAATKRVTKRTSLAVNASDGAPAPVRGAGAPVGLSVSHEAAESGAERLVRFREENGGHIENEPFTVEDGEVKYRLKYHLDNGDVISGNGATLNEQMDDLESKMGGAK